MSRARRSKVLCATQKFRPKIWQKYTATIEDVNLTKRLFHARLLDRSPLPGARNCLVFVSQRFHRLVYFLIEFLANQSQFCKLSIIHVLCLALRIGHFRRRNNDGRSPFLVGCRLVKRRHIGLVWEFTLRVMGFWYEMIIKKLGALYVSSYAMRPRVVPYWY